MVKIYLELAIPIIIFATFFLWSIWFRWSRRRARKKYDPNNDDGRKAEESRKEELEKERTGGGSEGRTTRDNGGGSEESPKQSNLSRGSTPITEQELFPATDPSESREGDSGNKQNSKSPRGFFGKFRRKRKG
tara:strand:- start:1237 stop:1635 length:399 start_codon:yes stop_codon:yes gene_type:complete